jgi:hypothetical protein
MPAGVSKGRSTYTRPSTGLTVFSVSIIDSQIISK